MSIAELENGCDCVVNFSIDGKATLVLVGPSLNVKVLKKVTAQSGDCYNGNIGVRFVKGRNAIKIVWRNCSESFKIFQQDGLFKYDDSVEGTNLDMNSGLGSMFGENFSVGSKANA